MLLILALASAFSGSDVDRLGADRWSAREAAESRLRFYGLLALPAIRRAQHSEDPEIRYRANRLAAPWDSLSADFRAAAWLTDYHPVDRFKLWRDVELRWRLWRVARANGVSDWPADCLVNDGEWNPFQDGTHEEWAEWGLYECRNKLGVEVPWYYRVIE